LINFKKFQNQVNFLNQKYNNLYEISSYVDYINGKYYEIQNNSTFNRNLAIQNYKLAISKNQNFIEPLENLANLDKNNITFELQILKNFNSKNYQKHQTQMVTAHINQIQNKILRNLASKNDKFLQIKLQNFTCFDYFYSLNKFNFVECLALVHKDYDLACKYGHKNFGLENFTYAEGLIIAKYCRISIDDLYNLTNSLKTSKIIQNVTNIEIPIKIYKKLLILHNDNKYKSSDIYTNIAAYYQLLQDKKLAKENYLLALRYDVDNVVARKNFNLLN